MLRIYTGTISPPQITHLASLTDARIKAPLRIATTLNGSILVSDPIAGEVYGSDSNNGRVQVPDLSGRHLRNASRYGTREGEPARPQASAIDSEERLHRVLCYTCALFTAPKDAPWPGRSSSLPSLRGYPSGA